MPIGNAIQRGKTVYVYNEKGSQLFTKSIGSSPHDGLVGYTGSTVSIRQGNTIFTFNERGAQLYTHGV